MNRLLEIHDTKLAAIESGGPDVVLHLAPAYVHRSDGRPGVDPGTGWLQDFDLLIYAAVVETVPLELPCRLSGGSIALGEARWNNVIPLPLRYHGEEAGRVSFVRDCECARRSGGE